MKRLLAALICLTGILLADANTEWVDAQIEAIKPPRQGVSHSAIDRISNPFLYTSKKVKRTPKRVAKRSKTTRPVRKTSSARLKLLAVMNNSALINGKWYKLNDSIHGYTLAKVNADSVMLTKYNTKRMLFVSSKNKNIKIQVK
jgi:hypothetical protein